MLSLICVLFSACIILWSVVPVEARQLSICQTQFHCSLVDLPSTHRIAEYSERLVRRIAVSHPRHRHRTPLGSVDPVPLHERRRRRAWVPTRSAPFAAGGGSKAAPRAEISHNAVRNPARAAGHGGRGEMEERERESAACERRRHAVISPNVVRQNG